MFLKFFSLQVREILYNARQSSFFLSIGAQRCQGAGWAEEVRVVKFEGHTRAAEAGGIEYTVQAGDSIYAIAKEIARRKGSESSAVIIAIANDISKINQLKEPSKIYANKTILNLGEYSSYAAATQNRARRFADTIAAKPDGDSAQERINETPERIVPERQAPDDTAEWTPDGTLEPKLSPAELETLRQLGEARAEDDPIHYDPATGLDMSSYMAAYTDSERSAVRENLKYSLQELRAADRTEELGSFDTTKFAAIKHEGMYVLLPFGLDQQEAGALADYLCRFHRTAPVEARRAFSVVSQAAEVRRASGHSIIDDPVPVEDTSVAGNQTRQPLFDMNRVADELFGPDDADADASVMADFSHTPKK